MMEKENDVATKIDVGALLDDISKKTNAFIGKLKKSLPLTSNKFEMEGEIARVRYNERIDYFYTTKTQHNEPQITH
jgi:hypothetical protein